MRVTVFLMLGLGWFGHNAETVDFDKTKPGVPPADWTFPNTSVGEPGRWMVHPDITAPSKPNVLAQLTADKHRGYSAVALFNRGQCLDGDLSVNLKMVSGKLDQTAGLIWRFQDPKNYYKLFVDANGDRISVHKVIDGKSIPIVQSVGTGQISSSVSRRIDLEEWVLVKVVFREQRAVVFFNHRKLIEVEDPSITKSGKTGVWTKGDTVAYFDDFRLDKKKD